MLSVVIASRFGSGFFFFGSLLLLPVLLLSICIYLWYHLETFRLSNYVHSGQVNFWGHGWSKSQNIGANSRPVPESCSFLVDCL